MQMIYEISMMIYEFESFLWALKSRFLESQMGFCNSDKRSSQVGS